MLVVNPHIFTELDTAYNAAFRLVKRKIMILHRSHRLQTDYEGFSMIDNKIALYQAALFIAKYMTRITLTGGDSIEDQQEELEYSSILNALFKCDVKAREAMELIFAVAEEPESISVTDNSGQITEINTTIDDIPTWIIYDYNVYL